VVALLTPSTHDDISNKQSALENDRRRLFAKRPSLLPSLRIPEVLPDYAMPSPVSSDTLQIVINIIYGTIASLIGVVTICQGYKGYKMWHEYRERRANSDRGRITRP